MGRETWDRARVEAIVATFPAHGWDLDRAAAAHGLSRNTLESALRRVLGRSFGDMQRAAASGAAVVFPAPAVPVAPPIPEPVAAQEEEDGPAFQSAGEVTVEVGADTLVTGIGDLHAPEMHRPTWHAWLKWCQDHRPGIIYVSELFEWGSVSKHNGGNWGAMWKADVEAAKRILVQLRSVNPDARIIMGEANHDTRLPRFLETDAPQFVGAMTIPGELGLADFGIEWVPERVMVRIGAMKLLHGHQLAPPGPGENKFLPKFHTVSRAIPMFGEPGVTVIYWHTHKHQTGEEPHVSGLKRAMNIACTRTLLPAWLGPRVAGWSHQFLAAYVGSGGQTTAFPVSAENGSFVWEGRRYSGGEVAKAA